MKNACKKKGWAEEKNLNLSQIKEKKLLKENN